MFKKLFFLLFLFSLQPILAQETSATLSGYLTDSKNGEALIGAKVVIASLNMAAVTNTYGFYSLTVPSGKYKVEFRSAIYPIDTKEIDLTNDVRFNYELGVNYQEIQEVVVNAKKGENVN